MRALVDGHNAMHRLRIRARDHESARRELCRRVRDVAPDAIVFFDAKGSVDRPCPSLREEGVRVVYVRRRDADEAILEEVRDADRPEEIVVVSDDREVAGRAAQLGARAASVGQFFRGARAPADPVPRRKRDAKGARGTTVPARPPAPPRNPRGKALTPADFGLPEFVDLSDPDALRPARKRPPRNG